MVRLTAKQLDIDFQGVLLHQDDARAIGVLDGDRVQIIAEEKGTFIQAFVATTTTLLPKGTAGIYHRTNLRLGVTDGESVEFRVANRPASSEYIKKKMDGGKLNSDEMVSIVNDIVNDILSPAETSAYITSSYINGLDMDEIEYLTRAMVQPVINFSLPPDPLPTSTR